MQISAKATLSLLLLLIVSIAATSQHGTISGKIIDQDKKPVAGATVSLLKETTVVKNIAADNNGMFSLTAINDGRYTLKITAAGFAPLVTDSLVVSSSLTEQERIFTLKPFSELLQAVSVTAKKQFIERKIDRTVMNVDALLSNAGLSALEVLENAPGVIVSSEGDISLKGKSGVMIFIDDKPTYLSGADLANYLKGLPSGTLDKIEIIPNPPARYDAAGNAGVINIRTKKTKVRGFNGGLNLNYNQGKYARTNNSINFNYRSPKINFFGTGSYATANTYNDLDIYRYYQNPDGSLRSTFFQNSFIRRHFTSSNLKLGLDYFLTPKTTIGILLSGIYRPSNESTINRSVVANGAGVVDSVITANNKEEGKWKNGSVNLNFLYRYSDNKEISFDLDYITYDSKEKHDFLNGIYGPSGNLKSTDGLIGNLPSDISIYSAKADYSTTLKSKAVFAAGAKTSFVNTDNAANYFTVINNITAPDYNITNHFLYKETINAAYVNLNKDWSKFSMQAGLRLENTISNGHQLGNPQKADSSFRRSYTNLFPTLYLLYKLDTNSNNQLAFSYGRRIDRPYYQDLNPFISPLDKFSIYVGNPYLQPSFTDAFELSHIFKNQITTTLSYSYTADIVQETIDLANSIYISRPANIGKSSVLGLGVSGSVKIKKLITTNFYAEVQNRHYKGVVYEYALDTSLVYFGANITNQASFGKGWSAEISGNYRTGILVGQIISSQTGRVNAAIGKKILNNKGSLKLNFRDIFRTGLNHGIITSIKNAYATYRNWGDTRSVMLSFSYNFGKTNKGPRNRNSGAETEQNRVKD